MSSKFEIHADIRTDLGKGASRRLRHTDNIPAVVYGAGETAQSLTLNHEKVRLALNNESFYSSILTLKVAGKKAEKVILKAVQRDPAKPRVHHLDFLRVRADQKLHMKVPLHFLGEEKAPGLSQGGIFSHIMNDVEVSCFPDDLPEHIDVEVSHLELDQSVHLSELKLPKGVELVAFAHGVEGHDQQVVSIHIPRIIEEEVAEEVTEEGAAPAEGEATAPEASAAEEPKDKE